MTSKNKSATQFPCCICQKLTDKTCSLCLKKFYCSQQHQQIDWHMRHKLECEGKIAQSSNKKQNTQFKIYDTSKQIQTASRQIRMQNQSKQFISLFQERLILRKKTLDKYLTINQYSASQVQVESVQIAEQLCKISKEITQIYKPTFSTTLQQVYNISTNTFLLQLDQILDKCLLARCYHKANKKQEVKKFLLSLNDSFPTYPQNCDDRYKQCYQNVIKSVIKISEMHNIDKTTQLMYSNYIKMIEKMEGVWQQVYAYMNMGIWYCKKTYFSKAIKCFNYCLELINSNKSLKDPDNSILIKADITYNISICLYSLSNQTKALQSMQQAYRLRVKAIGKNSIQSSECLQCLARWTYQHKNWEDCLHYLQECHRIRKINPSFPKQLQRIQKLIQQVYGELRRQKQKNEQQLNPKPAKYYQNLLSPPRSPKRGSSLQKPESFAKQLSEEKRQLISFKVVITPQMAQTYSSQQWGKLNQLIDLTDTKMDKEQARKIIFQSQFSNCLREDQRDVFIKMNKID